MEYRLLDNSATTSNPQLHLTSPQSFIITFPNSLEWPLLLISSLNPVDLLDNDILMNSDNLKLVSAIFYQIFNFSQNDSPLQTMNVFYFI